MKKFFVIAMFMMISMLSFGNIAFAGYQIQSDIKILPVMTAGEYQVAVIDDFGNSVVGISVSGRFFEHINGIEPFDQVQNRITNGEGKVVFNIPPTNGAEDNFIYFSVWVDSDLSSLQHQLVWFTNQAALAAKVSFSCFKGLVPSQSIMCCFVENAWGEALQGVAVEVISGDEYFPSSKVAMTDEFGMAAFYFVGDSKKGEATIKVQVEALSFLQAKTHILWRDYTGNIPQQPVISTPVVLIGEGDRIIAKASFYEGDIPVFSFPVGETFKAVFTLYDKNHLPVTGENITSVFPAWEGVTDGNGQVVITLPASAFQGHDFGSVWVTSQPDVILDFKIVYE